MQDSLPLNQVIVGCGSPLAPQVKLAGLPSTALVSAGGREISGRPVRRFGINNSVDRHATCEYTLTQYKFTLSSITAWQVFHMLDKHGNTNEFSAKRYLLLCPSKHFYLKSQLVCDCITFSKPCISSLIYPLTARIVGAPQTMWALHK